MPYIRPTEENVVKIASQMYKGVVKARTQIGNSVTLCMEFPTLHHATSYERTCGQSSIAASTELYGLLLNRHDVEEAVTVKLCAGKPLDFASPVRTLVTFDIA